MDIVNRLKLFMDSESIGSTQFADACKIPRPTLSQILSGRNKKISDEVISKIHEAYPRLSVLWLLFGEGPMSTNANNEISEPQNGGYIDFSSPQNTDTANVTNASQSHENDDVFASEKIIDSSLFDEGDQNPLGVQLPLTPVASHPISIAADGNKSIVNIMVFYSDNSFQSFVPASNPSK